MVLWIKALAAWKEMGATGIGPREASPSAAFLAFSLALSFPGSPQYPGTH